MPLERLQHALIQTVDLPATVRWWHEVLGLQPGSHPDFGFPVEWLYLDGEDVLHLTQGGADVSANRHAYLGQQSQAEAGTGVIDHLAFRASDLPGMLARLRKLGVEAKARRVNAQGLFQLFLFDPNGVKVELNFAAEEADRHGITPELMASDLPR
jgi:catechol 2,3-dioxygenase-like lactoylglutathione lyase family enzyme